MTRQTKPPTCRSQCPCCGAFLPRVAEQATEWRCRRCDATGPIDCQKEQS